MSPRSFSLLFLAVLPLAADEVTLEDGAPSSHSNY